MTLPVDLSSVIPPSAPSEMMYEATTTKTTMTTMNDENDDGSAAAAATSDAKKGLGYGSDSSGCNSGGGNSKRKKNRGKPLATLVDPANESLNENGTADGDGDDDDSATVEKKKKKKDKAELPTMPAPAVDEPPPPPSRLPLPPRPLPPPPPPLSSKVAVDDAAGGSSSNDNSNSNSNDNGNDDSAYQYQSDGSGRGRSRTKMLVPVLARHPRHPRHQSSSSSRGRNPAPRPPPAPHHHPKHPHKYPPGGNSATAAGAGVVAAAGGSIGSRRPSPAPATIASGRPSSSGSGNTASEAHRPDRSSSVPPRQPSSASYAGAVGERLRAVHGKRPYPAATAAASSSLRRFRSRSPSPASFSRDDGTSATSDGTMSDGGATRTNADLRKRQRRPMEQQRQQRTTGESRSSSRPPHRQQQQQQGGGHRKKTDAGGDGCDGDADGCATVAMATTTSTLAHSSTPKIAKAEAGKDSLHTLSQADKNTNDGVGNGSNGNSAKSMKTPPASYAKALQSSAGPTPGSGTPAVRNLFRDLQRQGGAAGESGGSGMASLPPSRGGRSGGGARKGGMLGEEMRALLKGFDPEAGEVKALTVKLFGPATGLADPEVRALLKAKPTGKKQWELRKRLEDKDNELKRLRPAFGSYLKNKNQLVVGLEKTEGQLRGKLMRAFEVVARAEERESAAGARIRELEAENTRLAEGQKDLRREFETSNGMVQSLTLDLGSVRIDQSKSLQEHTQTSIALAVSEARVVEVTKQAEGWRLEVNQVASSKADAVRQAETALSATHDRENAMLKDECAQLRTTMSAREEELGRILNMTATSAFEERGKDAPGTRCSGVGRSNSFLDTVKREVEGLREQKDEAEQNLNACRAELARAKSDSESATERATAKDKDLSELMKGVVDMQRSGQEREQEGNALRKATEDRLAEAEKHALEHRDQLSTLTHEKKALEDCLETIKVECETHKETIRALQKELADANMEHATHESNLRVEQELRSRAEEKEKEERQERIATAAQMMAMTQEHARAEAQMKESNDGLERQWNERERAWTEASRERDDEMRASNDKIIGLETEQTSLKESLAKQKTTIVASMDEEVGRLKGEVNVLKGRLKSEENKSQSIGMVSEEKSKELELKIREGQIERRKMHNTIQELRGNVRVFARIRPFLPNDKAGDDPTPSIVPTTESELKVAKQNDPTHSHKFSYDRVFSPSVGQEAVFDEVSEFIQSSLDGYSVCLISYGQTGSGKTHTMQGTGTGQMRGIIPRSIEQIGRYRHTLELEGWKYEMTVSFLEIYNETIRDLLKGSSDGVKHEIKVDGDGRRSVSNLTLMPLDPTDKDAVDNVMRLAAKHRSVAQTEMNAVSSRSHSVFTLHLTATHVKQKQVMRGTLNLVDLAGSERLERSGATGDRAKEACAINKSLSSLTDVFVAIGAKQAFVPFRNSKLTYLLQPALSGDGKTLMLVNVSPTDDSVQESLCSLKFASKVNKCELGKAKRTIEEAGEKSSSTVARGKGVTSSAIGRGKGTICRNVKRKV